MKFALPMPHTMELKALTQPWEFSVTGADQKVIARRGEELGYDMLAVPEHFVIPHTHVELSGPHYFHSTVAQAYIAGATHRIAVNSAVTLLPLQHPIITAKALATADWMSGGRIMVTFGVGWDEEEFDILGVPFHERGRMADEYLAAIIELWTSDSPSFDGKYVSFDAVAFDPKPVQKPHIPIWIGGDADRRCCGRLDSHRDGSRSSRNPTTFPPRSSSSSRSRRSGAGRSRCVTGWAHR
jgi:probable F420-dependent oxidoreductase